MSSHPIKQPYQTSKDLLTLLVNFVPGRVQDGRPCPNNRSDLLGDYSIELPCFTAKRVSKLYKPDLTQTGVLDVRQMRDCLGREFPPPFEAVLPLISLFVRPN